MNRTASQLSMQHSRESIIPALGKYMVFILIGISERILL